MPYADKEKERARGIKRNERYRKRREADEKFKEEQREKWRAWKKAQREARGEEINAKQREHYRKDVERSRELIYSGKDRRNPTRGLAGLVRDVRSGRKSARELIDRLSTAVKQSSSLIHGK